MDRSDAEVKGGGHPVMPVSVKGVIVVAGRVLLLANDRGEWELPGGRPDRGETDREALRREIHEELGLAARVGPRIADEPLEVVPGRHVRIVSYGCEIPSADGARLSPEHRRLIWAPVGALADLPLPDVYRRAIALWVSLGIISEKP